MPTSYVPGCTVRTTVHARCICPHISQQETHPMQRMYSINLLERGLFTFLFVLIYKQAFHQKHVLSLALGRHSQKISTWNSLKHLFKCTFTFSLQKYLLIKAEEKSRGYHTLLPAPFHLRLPHSITDEESSTHKQELLTLPTTPGTPPLFDRQNKQNHPEVLCTCIYIFKKPHMRSYIYT